MKIVSPNQSLEQPFHLKNRIKQDGSMKVEQRQLGRVLIKAPPSRARRDEVARRRLAALPNYAYGGQI